MVKKIKQTLLQRLKTEVPFIIRRIQHISLSIATLDIIILGTKEKMPDFIIPDIILNIIFWAAMINAILLQFTTHKDFEK